MMLNLTINGKPCQAQEGSTILEAARQNGIHIPSLCYLKDVHQYGTCRVCVVEVEGMKNLQALGEELGVTECRLSGEMGPAHVDVSPSITRDTAKCILCRRCVTVCNQVQEVGAINAQNRGFDTVISPAMGLPLNSTACAMCGQCVSFCPTGALTETDAIGPVWKALEDERKVTVIQVAPAVRAPWARSSECLPAPAAPAKLPPPSTPWASTMCLTPTSPPISPFWRRAPNCSSV